jgi:hypothetical protein
MLNAQFQPSRQRRVADEQDAQLLRAPKARRGSIAEANEKQGLVKECAPELSQTTCWVTALLGGLFKLSTCCTRIKKLDSL